MYTIFEWVIGNQSPDFKEKGHESQIKTSFFGSDFGFSGEPLLTALKIYIGKLCCLLADFYGFVETLCSLFIHKSRSSFVLWLVIPLCNRRSYYSHTFHVEVEAYDLE